MSAIGEQKRHIRYAARERGPSVISWRQIGTKINASVGRGSDRPGQALTRRDGDGERPGRRAALRTGILAGATAVGAVALAQRPGSASASSYVVTDPLTNNTCVLPSGDTSGATDTTNINGALAAGHHYRQRPRHQRRQRGRRLRRPADGKLSLSGRGIQGLRGDDRLLASPEVADER